MLNGKFKQTLKRLAIKLKLVDNLCPFCGHPADPRYETKDKYHCSDCARRWFKVTGAMDKYSVKRENF